LLAGNILSAGVINIIEYHLALSALNLHFCESLLPIFEYLN